MQIAFVCILIVVARFPLYIITLCLNVCCIKMEYHCGFSVLFCIVIPSYIYSASWS